MNPNPGAPKRTDLYAVLGVARDADADTIKQAYRKLARELHPDVNDAPEAEERFKEVSEAYTVLSSPERRAAYDEFGDLALDPNFDLEKAREMRDAFGAGGFDPAGFTGAFTGGFAGGFGPGADAEFANGGFADLDDLLGGLFGGLRGGGLRGDGLRGDGPRRRRGPDRVAELELDFVEAALGSEQRLTLSAVESPGATETLTVRIPAGVADGGTIRLAGKGAPGFDGGPPGDLRVRVRVRPHRLFRREGRDIHLELPITVSEAALGADIEVPTLDGRVKLRVPPGTDGGSRLRLRGKGIPATRGGAAGDLYVQVRIRVPRDPDDETRAALEKLADAGPHGLRDDLLP